MWPDSAVLSVVTRTISPGSTVHRMSAAGSDDFDAIPDQFEAADVDWNAIPGLEASTSSARPTSANSRSSFDYWHDDSLDENFLAAVDDLERRAVEETNQSGACPVIYCCSSHASASGENACCDSTLNQDSITPSGNASQYSVRAQG
jgi:hypothetical protein